MLHVLEVRRAREVVRLPLKWVLHADAQMQQPDEQQWHEDDPHKLDKDEKYEHVVAALSLYVSRLVQGPPKRAAGK